MGGGIKDVDGKVKSFGAASGGGVGGLALNLIRKGVMTASEAKKILRDIQKEKKKK
jgi:polyhydroxyalkanoate synthesis regulator phasin|tara:strand:- start:6273 stop:6440 length:168 start_codon:yes stop_codon:yes gene_type:complete